ncbi:DM13 domain-containing protein [Actinomadura sp. 6K520]|uniref:DM13 domain-containing protein n=1 Tax=Actinomadura sp. 6K520 TaxID=2530364 RepID=UPI001047F90A|nr:DM13 domain-containing protein [Actinomadura sp. 6K520]TDE37190.1 electron transporter [Actinomadura sp. 6K520]
MSRRPVVAVLAVLVVAAGAGLYLFQPWKAFTDTTVTEALPSAPAAAPGQDTGPRRLAEGKFVTHEHGTSGMALAVRLANGDRLLRLEDLSTSDGPDLRVYLSRRSADAVREGLGKGAVDLGKLKGNLGDQNYTVPADTDVSGFRSAVIWCKRFSVSFGAADLTPGKG